jgi:hypothetical protein
MTLSELYLWFCFVIVSLVGLWGICLCLSYVAIYLIEKTMRHLEIWKVFVDWIIERRKAQEK